MEMLVGVSAKQAKLLNQLLQKKNFGDFSERGIDNGPTIEKDSSIKDSDLVKKLVYSLSGKSEARNSSNFSRKFYYS